MRGYGNLRAAAVLLVAAALGLAFVALFISTPGCKTTAEPPRDWQQTAYMKLGNSPVPTEAWVEAKAQYDWIALTWGAWAGPLLGPARDELRRRNPDIHLGSYVSAFTCPRWTERGAPGTFARRWWDATSPFITYNARGDTATCFGFKKSYVWDVLNPAARGRVVAIVADYVESCGLDWLMMDFMSVPLGSPEDAVDLDADGVPQWADPDESAALRAAWFALVAELRAYLPPGTKIIPNGGLAIADPEFSLAVDGCYVEGFPRWFFGSGDSWDFAAALDPANGPASLPALATRGRWYGGTAGVILVEDTNDRRDYGYVTALYDGLVEMKRELREGVDCSPAVDLAKLGQPLEPALFKPPGTTSRRFTNGTLTVQAGNNVLTWDFR